MTRPKTIARLVQNEVWDRIRDLVPGPRYPLRPDPPVFYKSEDYLELWAVRTQIRAVAGAIAAYINPNDEGTLW